MTRTELKDEFLNGISDLKVDSSDFWHELEDSRTTYASCDFYFETENLNVTITLTEERTWYDWDDCEKTDLIVEDLQIFEEEGLIEDDLKLSHATILKNIRY